VTPGEGGTLVLARHVPLGARWNWGGAQKHEVGKASMNEYARPVEESMRPQALS
jgi:hypothetical protein